MAKKSVIARQRKREHLVELYAERRKALKEAGDFEALDKLPRNSAKVRLRNRCQLTGRPRAYNRLFGLSRNKLRELAMNGKIPGVRKASW
ncbi:MAG: 30S ribosomal protein S14 [Chitinophagales bacterium]|mgnify:FL=1|jgi:small subunit ribosomal protein S14|nr:30S ribosomal protein S14 [Chitinophagales bacterium]